eukprot:TRINITY_DN6435_c0_g1_i3.p1 TRINITY_DN6435_c0_g1~~TRINITY_DN6435_c0_g1_i3.p1  ORF type:complete len:136 (+),score=19.74 TRINITY_DN6435_c0_g1_i3:517-924(+)
MGGALYLLVTGAACYTSGRRMMKLLRLHSLHTSQSGITLLRRSEMHARAGGSPESDPAKMFLEGVPVTKKKYTWSLSEFIDYNRMQYENLYEREYTRDGEASLRELKESVQREQKKDETKQEEKIQSHKDDIRNI